MNAVLVLLEIYLFIVLDYVRIKDDNAYSN